MTATDEAGVGRAYFHFGRFARRDAEAHYKNASVMLAAAVQELFGNLPALDPIDGDRYYDGTSESPEAFAERVEAAETVAFFYGPHSDEGQLRILGLSPVGGSHRDCVVLMFDRHDRDSCLQLFLTWPTGTGAFRVLLPKALDRDAETGLWKLR